MNVFSGVPSDTDVMVVSGPAAPPPRGPITEELLPPSFIAEEYPTLAAALLRGTDPVAEQWHPGPSEADSDSVVG